MRQPPSLRQALPSWFRSRGPVAGRRTIIHGGESQRRMAHQEGGIAGRRRAVEFVEEGLVRGIAKSSWRPMRSKGAMGRSPATRGASEIPQFPRHHRRHALADLGGHVAGITHHAVVVGVNIDEPGATTRPVSIDVGVGRLAERSPTAAIRSSSMATSA